MIDRLQQLRRPLVYGLAVGSASLGFLFFFSLASARAAETAVTHFDDVLVSGGKTLILASGAKAGIFPGALPGPADVQWTVSGETVPALPANRSRLGSVYRLTVTGVTQLTAGVNPAMAVSLPFGQSYWIRQVWLYDRTTRAWSPLRTSLNTRTNMAQAPTKSLDGLYAILEDRQQQQGIASWYCRLHCSSRYPTLHGTSNDYPIGSSVRVRNLENGATVKVKIISRWGQPAGRIIDLSWAAFNTLHPSNQGLAKVMVTPASATIVAVTGGSGPAIDKTETLPVLKVSGDGVPPPDAVQALAYSVYDQTSGTVLGGRQADEVRPIASIGKLMTAMVFLDTKTSLDKVVTYAVSGLNDCSCLAISPGETLTVRNLFYAMLVGSANNATNALVLSTGLSRAEFIARMNTKAGQLGLTHTQFFEPTGLDPRNVSTATELAKMAAYALHQYEPIRFATTRLSYTFSTINTAKSHTVTLRYSMYGRSLPLSGLVMTGGKTGFLNESLYTYALRVKNAQGAQVVTVVLGSPTITQRLNDETALVNWAFGHHLWK